MIPIRDHNPSGRVPFVTWALMAANIAIFLSYVGFINVAPLINAFYYDWAMMPGRLMQGEAFHTLVTSMFLHAGWMHLAGNMLFLFIFGDNVEDEMGHLPYLGFYLLSGIAASLVQVASDPFSSIPTVGASGAIAGVMGAYMLLFPKARVDILLVLIVIIRIIPVPAWIMLALWFGMQFVGGLAAGPSDGGGVAYWAHAGGFAVGAVMALPVWLRRGGQNFWRQNRGLPPHPEAVYSRSRIPRVRRR